MATVKITRLEKDTQYRVRLGPQKPYVQFAADGIDFDAFAELQAEGGVDRALAPFKLNDKDVIGPLADVATATAVAKLITQRANELRRR